MINRAERIDIENRLPDMVASLKRDVEALKTRQFVGGDNLVVTGYLASQNVTLAGEFSLTVLSRTSD